MRITPTKGHTVIQKTSLDNFKKVGTLLLPEQHNLAEVVAGDGETGSPREKQVVVTKFPIEQFLRIHENYIVPNEDIVAFYEN